MNYTLYRFALLHCHHFKRFNYQFNIIIVAVLLYMIQIQLLFLQQCLSKLNYFISSIGVEIVYLHITFLPISAHRSACCLFLLS